MNIQQAYQQLLTQLYSVYDTREAANIGDMVIEKVTAQRKIDRITYRDIPVSDTQQTQLQQITADLLKNRPVQYAIGHAWFMNKMFQVNESVLIPRPETEELVDWIVKDISRYDNKDLSVLDIGTGSGCIPISIKKQQPAVTVSAIDISESALQVAKVNSVEHQALIDFLHVDILDRSQWNELGQYDIIVSNPPYITQKEAEEMRSNVLDYEPSLALFVPDDNALIFYKTIAAFAKKHLKQQGKVYVEINESYGLQVIETFMKGGSKNVELKKDMQGKDRMVKAFY